MAPKRRDRDGDAANKAAATTTTTVNGASGVAGGGDTASGAGVAGSVANSTTATSAVTNGHNGSMQHLPTPDSELFLAAFDKPTQIYRYLRTRNMISPFYLFRNLTYMKERLSRSARATRSAPPTFRVNSLLAIKQQQQHQQQKQLRHGGSPGAGRGDFMTLMFLGFHDKTVSDADVRVEVETYLSHSSLRKRKDGMGQPSPQERIGYSVVKVNPEDSAAACLSKVPAVSVATDSLHTVAGGGVNGIANGHGDTADRKPIILQLMVTVTPNDRSSLNAANNNHHHSDTIDLESDTDDMLPKNHHNQHHHRPAPAQPPAAKRVRTAAHVSYELELIVFDKHSRCLLTDGEYELALKERPGAARCAYSPKKHPAWETIPDTGIASLDKAAFEEFQVRPVLKLRLAWTRERSAPLIDRPLPITVIKKQQLSPSADAVKHNNNNNSNRSDCDQSGGVEAGVAGVDYCFVYNNNTRQQTQSCATLNCPWCCMDCISLYALLKHLKLCHPRFNFTYVPQPPATTVATGTGSTATATGTSLVPPADSAAQLQPRRVRIDVSINELFDGSYTGSPNDLCGPSGMAFSRAGPVQRTVVTRILVCRPRRTKPSLNEFLEIDENELNAQRPYISGHNRLYHHTMTCLPVHPKELDIDSEGENDPAWLQHKTMMMIDEFTDVNEGEKELMKMWNLHIMKNGYVGDIQIPLACDMFIDLRVHELLAKNLYNNFVIHMCNLSDYGLVSGEALIKIVQKLQRQMFAHAAGRQTLTASRAAQLQYWEQHGQARHEQKLLDQPKKEQAATSAAAAAVDTAATTTTEKPSKAVLSAGGVVTRTTTTAAAAAAPPAVSSLPPRLSSSRNADSVGLNGGNNNTTLPNKTTTLSLPQTVPAVAAPAKPANIGHSSSGGGGSSANGGGKGRDSNRPNKSNAAAAAATTAEPRPAPISNKRRFSNLRDPAPPPASAVVATGTAVSVQRIRSRRNSIVELAVATNPIANVSVPRSRCVAIDRPRRISIAGRIKRQATAIGAGAPDAGAAAAATADDHPQEKAILEAMAIRVLSVKLKRIES